MSEENKLHNGQLLYIKTRFLPVVQVNFSPSYSGYPIFHYYKVTDAKIAKIENPTGGGFTRMDNKEYWRPFPSITETYEYTPGDELVQQIYQGRNTAVTEKDPANTASRLNNPTSVANTKYAGASTNEMRIWGGDTYKATTQTIKWESISKYDTIPVPALRMAKTNPYISENIRVWAKVGGSNLTQDTGFVYWWNPVDKVFHIVNPSIVFATNINTERVTGESQSQYSLRDSLNEGKILALILQGKTREQAIEQISNASAGGGAGGGAGGNGGAGAGSKGTATLAAGGGSTSSTTGTAPNSTIRATVRVRGNFGYIEPGEIEGGGAQMVQYYKSSSGQAPLTARHIFSPKPNQINYQNIGSEWTEIERAGRIPLVDWKNYKLMRVSFQFLVIPDLSLIHI